MTDPDEYDLPGRVIGLAMKVHPSLGPGYLESVYRNALAFERRRGGFQVAAEKPIDVFYEGELVGAFLTDLLVDEQLLLELKAVLALAKIHEVQLVNYLTATGLKEGLLLNFGAERLEFKKKFRFSAPGRWLGERGLDRMNRMDKMGRGRSEGSKRP